MRTVTVAAGMLALISSPCLAADPLALMTGVWGIVSPPEHVGEKIIFTMTGTHLHAQMPDPLGQAGIALSNVADADLAVSGTISSLPYTCNYELTVFDSKNIAWRLTQGDTPCLRNILWKKDP